MNINPNRKILEIKREFRIIYPGLKLEFYKSKHEEHTGSSVKSQHDDQQTLSHLSTSKMDGVIDLAPDQTIANVERQFEEFFGLHVQIFRKSKSLWLQTIATDGWSLEKQNRKGVRSTQIH